jgi:hypothetical protein
MQIQQVSGARGRKFYVRFTKQLEKGAFVASGKPYGGSPESGAARPSYVTLAAFLTLLYPALATEETASRRMMPRGGVSGPE